MHQMVGAAWCQKCRQAKEILQNRGYWEQIEYLDYEQPAGKELVTRFAAAEVPFFVFEGLLIPTVGEFLRRLEQR